MTKPAPNKLKASGFIIAFIGAVLFSTKAVIVKKAFADIRVDALSLLALRMVCSLPFYLFAFWLAQQKQNVLPLTKKQWINVVALGLFGYYLSSYFDFVGLQYISAGLERLILFLYPTFVVIINAVYFKQKITKLQATALMLTYAGIATAFLGELSLDVSNPGFFKGSLLVFICAITFSIYLAGSGRMVPAIGATRFTAYAMLAATAGVFVHFIAQGNWDVFKNSGTDVWGYGLLLAVAATVLPSFLIAAAMKKIGANNVAIVSCIGPVSTILQAHFVLGEKIFAVQLIGTALVVAGVLLASWRQQETVI
jgi:drug/metabolite transporter (DMT)-like permease